MTDTLTIIGYDQDDYCSHCGRKLVHCIKTAELGIVGASCFAKLIVPNRKRFSGNGRPTSSIVRELAVIRERYSDEGMRRLGRYPDHFVFERAA